jgi:predicted Zn-dependent protease
LVHDGADDGSGCNSIGLRRAFSVMGPARLGAVTEPLSQERSYSRADEDRADAFAVTIMHRLGRPTAPLGALLARIAGQAREEEASLLRSHPLTPERRAMLEAEDLPASGPALLDDGEWRDLKRICDR